MGEKNLQIKRAFNSLVEIQKVNNGGTWAHTHNVSTNILKSLSITPHCNIQLKLQNSRSFFSQGKGGDGGGHA
jgi:predicted transcriptional regulator